MKIVIIGSRKWKNEQAIIDFVDTLPDDALVISGCANGVDVIAITAANYRGLETLVRPANWKKYHIHGKPNIAGMIRNGEMIDEKPDLVVAFWDGSSTGTENMIARAKRVGIPVMINPTKFDYPPKQQEML